MLFRDYLKKHPDTIQQYYQLKQQLAKSTIYNRYY
ncbi:GrpB family protein [Bacillus thuringiensis]|nr:GrpB family protein [Bacillus thuringiensis]MEC2469807.1 GrpB family protein [Bacillus thuringiensis]MEC2563011.1 GrpB family protein [Bacillus thuringiensis]MEC2646656.1 GrpB family protein [Bacillus thuringiensis]MEC2727539.1 GrpB family protein [Bacillus thuringiensis]MEC2788832.1 GrpB family protein [Bacillus thuringiensis]